MNINHCTQVGSTTKMSLPPASNNEQIQIPRAPAAPIAAHMAEAPPVHAGRGCSTQPRSWSGARGKYNLVCGFTV